ncbi:11345_t:CDS:1, partial [Acaulospora morrowiae]
LSRQPPQNEEATKDSAEVVMASERDALKHGYLKRLSQFVKLHEQRYFVFTHEGSLNYFKNENDGTDAKEIMITRDVQIRNINGKNLEFEIETKTRTFRLIASTEKERDEWVSVLNEYKKTLPESDENKN